MDDKVYPDKQIRARIFRLETQREDRFPELMPKTAAMLQQLMNERDEAIKDLKALEAEVGHAMSNMDIEGWMDLIDLTRSEKYDTGKTG